MSTALVVLSLIWILNGLLVVFLVEIDGEDENDKTENRKYEDVDNKTDCNMTKSVNSKVQDSEPVKQKDVDPSLQDLSQNVAFINDTALDTKDAEVQVKNPIFAPVFKTPACLCMMVYAFFHFGGMIGTIIFLPPLLNESLLPKNHASLLNYSANSQTVTMETGHLEVTMTGPGGAMEIGHADVTMALMMFGGGGIVGDVLCGLVMNFGPLADEHFALFIANNFVMLIVVGKFFFTIYLQYLLMIF